MATFFFNDIHCTTHWPSAVTSVDLSNCYNRVAPPVCNIALQAFLSRHTSSQSIVSLFTIDEVFHKSRFWSTKGVLQKSLHPFFGIGQGAGSAPPGFLTMSTLMIMAYKSRSHGCQLHAMWTTLALMLAAILFVDDSGFLHCG